MSHGQNLRDLLEPLGVYRWEGTFQWGELQSQGAALDGVEAELESIQREMNLATAQAEGLDGVLALLGRPLKHLLRLCLRTGVGLAALAAFSPVGGLIGVSLGVNLANALVMGLLGVPGFGLLLMLHWALAL